MPLEPNQKQEPQLTDYGTRYEHLQDHYEALEACVEVLKSRGLYSIDDKQRLSKLTIAAEVMRNTIDSYAGMNSTESEYALYKVLNSIPEHPENIEGGRGTPLV
jgi:hypothetical protein